MPLQMLAIYASGAGLIILMFAFAAHNKKTGWKKIRPTLLEAIHDLYFDLGAQPEITKAAPVIHADSPDLEFSTQLLRLRGALGNSNVIATETRQLAAGVSSR